MVFQEVCRSLGVGGSLDNSCGFVDLHDIFGFISTSCHETVKVGGDILLYENLRAFASADWCPAGGCSATMGALHTVGLASIEALDANGSSLGPSMVGASGVIYGRPTSVPEPSALFLVLAAAPWIAIACARNQRRS
jgi:hypothetical protein